MPRKHYFWKVDEPPPEIGAHSLAKHRVFEQYTQRYIHILSSFPAQRELNLTIVDGFCGGGAYRFDGNVVAGSPLVLLRAVEAAEIELSAARQHGFKVNADFYFVDKVQAHIDFLHAELEKTVFKGEIGRTIHLSTDEFENKAANIISAIRAKGPANRALFFLDQYGWSEVSFASIRWIFEVLRNPEVLITFSVDSLIDYLCSQSSEARSGRAIELGPALSEAIINLRTESGQRYVIQSVLYKHICEKTGAHFYTPFFVRSPKGRRSYWLVHLSKHARARDEMTRLHWEMANTFVHPGKAGFNALGFDPNVDPNQSCFEFDFGSDARRDSLNAAVEELPHLIRQDSLQRQAPTSITELFKARCNETPLTLQLVSEAVTYLRDELKEVEVISPEGNVRPRAVNLSPKDFVRLRDQRSFFRALSPQHNSKKPSENGD